MWLYDSGHGYTQKCVVIRLVRLLLRRQPATNTSRWLYVLARGYTWLYIVHVPHSLQVHVIDVIVIHPLLSRP